MRVYIAGPYTHPDPVVNTRLAVEAAERLMSLDPTITPYVPHLSMLWHLIVPHDIHWWYVFDLRWVDVCDCVLRLPGESSGAAAECAYAREKGIPVFVDGPTLLINAYDAIVALAERKRAAE